MQGKLFSALTLILGFGLCGVSCNTIPVEIPVTHITIMPDTVTVFVGYWENLDITITPLDATDKSVT